MVITTHLMALMALLLMLSRHPLALEETFILTMMKRSLYAQTEVSLFVCTLSYLSGNLHSPNYEKYFFLNHAIIVMCVFSTFFLAYLSILVFKCNWLVMFL